MRYRVELAMYVEAGSPDEVRDLAEKVMDCGREALPSEGTIARGEPVTCAPVPRERQEFSAGASAC